MIKRAARKRFVKKTLDNNHVNMLYAQAKEEVMQNDNDQPVITEEKIAESTEKIDKINTTKNTGKKFLVLTEVWLRDQTAVLNKDPDLEYSWGRETDELEMVDFEIKGYTPAVGNEVCFGMKKPEPGKPKKRAGNRILMCCPKEVVAARENERFARLEAQGRNENKAKANELNAQGGKNVSVRVYEGIEQ